MAADSETRLLSRVIRDRDIAWLLEKGVDESWFRLPENQDVWRFVTKHWATYDEVPTSVTVKANFPTYRLLKVEDSPEYIFDTMVEWRKRQATIKTLQTAADIIADENDHEGALAVLRAGLSEIDNGDSRNSRDIDHTLRATDRFTEYEERRDHGDGMLGLPTGFPTVDLATAGLQAGQLIVEIAPPKVGKSVLALQVAQNIWDLPEAPKPMFLSFEMSNREQQYRFDAMHAKISHSRLTRGRLEDDEEERYLRSLKKIEKMQPFMFCDSVGHLTLSTVAAKVQILKPEILFIDGVYLMSDEVTGEVNTPASLTNLTRGLKRMAQRFEIPVFVTTQVLPWKMKGKQVTADAIGYSSSFVQDADVTLGLQRDDEDSDDTRILKVLESRNCGKTETDLLWLWEQGRFEEWQAAA
jgi:replicative DNA helicase